MAKSLQVIQAGMKVVTLPDGTAVLQKRRSRRRRFKTSAATRRKIATASKKLKIPVVRLSGYGFGVFDAATKAQALGGNMTNRVANFMNFAARNYTGINFSTGKFSFTDFMKGGGASLITMALSPVWTRGNKLLGASNIPVVRF